MAKQQKTFKFLFYFVLASFLTYSFAVLEKTFVSPCANSLSCEESFNFQIDNDRQAFFNGTEINPPDISLVDEVSNFKVLGEETSSAEKRIFVDLSTQTLKAYEGEDLFFETKVSTGKWFPTPTGDFTIWKKIRATKMSGGEGNDYYYLPNVPYVMFFSNSEVSAGRGFALHGAYWHNNFGHAMSHGCVNLRTIDAKKIYEWATPAGSDKDISSTKENPGTIITIYGKAP